MKRGQAAMEFLTTYGWAFVVMLIMVGAMSAFGVWSPDSLLPSKCVLETPFTCLDSKVDANGEITLLIQYLFTQRLSKVEVNISTYDCDLGTDDSYLSPDLVEKSDYLNASGDEYIRFHCTPSTTPSLDQKFEGDITLTYAQQGTGIEHTVIGNFVRRVE